MSFIGENTGQRLSMIQGIDLKATGPTTLFTVPSGKKCLVEDVVLEVTAAATVTVVAVIRIGKASAYTEWLAATTLTGLDTVGEVMSLARTANLLVHQTFNSGDTIKLDVTVGATATSLTVSAHVFGYTY